ncbi:MAG: hypothetical protein ACREJT_05900, partial [Myxococcota bacterium]
MRRLRVLALAAPMAGSCAHVTPPQAIVALALPHLADCPGSLRSTAELEGDWRIHERIRVRGDRIDESYGLVVQKIGPRLVLVGLTPFGAKAFSVTQIGVDVWSDSKLGAAQSVPPENVLRDLHRAHFLATDDPAFEGRALTRNADGSV